MLDPEVSLFAQNTKDRLRYCTNGAEAPTEHHKTGKGEGNPPGTDPEVAYTVTMQKSAEKVRQAVSTASKSGGCS
ncbi:hypothetical protein [Streptomyces poriticola]|uniref:hypothetical protein n=1 Tax=Streptomyces poriticola TaxID=3120506 RepID=UPI002FCE206F